ncbi:MAG: fructose-6-phosphate aldolase [Abitibacteriaceae bacterium]|nr:fructose-6-phosphate aldolase [Abditibacteriaceae bacterium]MBV9865974.1 fructose-6-phosphate aldolase [Abditibacteriaceae bacterium]
MKFFLDTADIKEVKEAASWGILDGVTTNPSHIAKSGKHFKDVVCEIAAIVPGPISAEVTATDVDGMLEQAHEYAAWGSNIVIKIPLILDGLKAVKKLSEEGIKTNVTLCFSSTQALLAAKAGATYISPFVGRLDDIGTEGMEVIREIRAIYDNYDYSTQILTASARSPLHIRDAAIAGSDVVTMPFETFTKLVKHPLTDIGLAKFLEDWKKVPQDKQPESGPTVK